MFNFGDESVFGKGSRRKNTVNVPISKLREIDYIYKNLPSYQIEFGGVMCGKKVGSSYHVDRFIWMPSMMPSPRTFSIDGNIVNKGEFLCDNSDLIGIFHTHSPDSPHPSRIDLRTSEDLDTLGCVVAKQEDGSMLDCFKGKKKYRVEYI